MTVERLTGLSRVVGCDPRHSDCGWMGWTWPARAPTVMEEGTMSAEDLERYETEIELGLYREYRDVVGLFSYVVETERRFYLTNSVDVQVRGGDGGEVFFEVRMNDAWVWDMYRQARFVKNVRVLTFKDVNVEELAKPDLQVPPEDQR